MLGTRSARAGFLTLLTWGLLFFAAGCGSPPPNEALGHESELAARFAALRGPYLGLTPPGMERELFAPGLVSDGLFNGLVSFTADGEELYFSSGFEKPFYFSALFHTQSTGEGWTEPIEFPLPRRKAFRPVLAPDGQRIVFITGELEPVAEGEETRIRIYFQDKLEGGWSSPRAIDFGEAFPYSVSQTSIAANGNLYFQAGYFVDGDEDIYVSRFVDGAYQAPEQLSDAINGPEHELHPCIAPDESFLLFDSGKPGGLGQHDIYVSFRAEDGTWSPAQNLGPQVNTSGDERRSSLSQDGKYLFFESKIEEPLGALPNSPMRLSEMAAFLASHGNGGEDVYWVDAAVIEALRPR